MESPNVSWGWPGNIWHRILSERSSTPTSGRTYHTSRGKLGKWNSSGPCSKPLLWTRPLGAVVGRSSVPGDGSARGNRVGERALWVTPKPVQHVPGREGSTWRLKVALISLAEVAKVVKKLLGGKAPGVDEIRPKMLKGLDIIGLSWLTRLFNVAWGSVTVPMDWVVMPIFKKGDHKVCSNYRGITLLSLLGKAYARMLEKSLRLLVQPQIQDEQCGFLPGHRTMDQLFAFTRLLEGFWQFAQAVYMSFVDL